MNKAKPLGLPLDGDQLLFFTELIALQFVSLSLGVDKKPIDAVSLVTCVSLESLLRESLRDLLQQPLRDQEFRTNFDRHFRFHPMKELRLIALPWMDESLVWES